MNLTFILRILENHHWSASSYVDSIYPDQVSRALDHDIDSWAIQ